MAEIPPNCRPVADPVSPRGGAIPGYAVRDDGAIFYHDSRRRAWIPLKVKTGPNGFRRVRIRVGEMVREMGIALIVLRAFVGPRPLGMEPLHFPDPDPANNRAENLRWAVRGSSKVGRMLGPAPPAPPKGAEHPGSVLGESDVPRIRDLYRAGVGYKEIAEMYDVGPETIRHLLTGNTWSHVPDTAGPVTMRRRGPSSEGATNTKLDRAEVEEIRGHLGAGMTPRVVARLYGVSTSTIRDIAKGRTWSEDYHNPEG